MQHRRNGLRQHVFLIQGSMKHNFFQAFSKNVYRNWWLNVNREFVPVFRNDTNNCVKHDENWLNGSQFKYFFEIKHGDHKQPSWVLKKFSKLGNVMPI